MYGIKGKEITDTYCQHYYYYQNIIHQVFCKLVASQNQSFLYTLSESRMHLSLLANPKSNTSVLIPERPRKKKREKFPSAE